MEIKNAEFVVSNTDYKLCPDSNKFEFAFIGRSNVGKSSLINMLTNHKKLAKVSGRPGKTQLINHFLINKSWYLVDLPGYGYAKVSKSSRKEWQKFIQNYLILRPNLTCVFVLIDSRHDAQAIDLEFIKWLGHNKIPFSIAFTKTDKLSKSKLDKNITCYTEELFKEWSELPPYFVTSAETKAGKEELLGYIDDIMEQLAE